MPIRSRINPGKLDMMLTFEYPADGTNSIGEHIKTWTTYRRTYGKIVANSDPEGFEASQLVGKDSISVLVRYDSGLNSTMRFFVNAESTYYYVIETPQQQREGFCTVRGIRRDNQ